jgi:mono/diheme cytochrome c family protein
MLCHSRAANFVLGLSTAQLNRDHDYGEVIDNQLRVWSHIGLTKSPITLDWREYCTRIVGQTGLYPKQTTLYVTEAMKMSGQRRTTERPTADADAALFEKLVDPADESAPLAARARSYLHANCAHCHTQSGGGNAQFQVAWWWTLDETKMIDGRPLHATYGVPEPKIVSPGKPECSLLMHRLEKQDRGRMPPIAVSLPDEPGIELIRRWIASLPTPRAPTRVEPD